MALIQINVSDEIKGKADEAFSRNGITTPMAMKMMVTQVATDGRTPFDGLFTGGGGLSERVYRDMVRAEVQEFGIIPDDASPYEGIPHDVLVDLGVDGSEIAR